MSISPARLPKRIRRRARRLKTVLWKWLPRQARGRLPKSIRRWLRPPKPPRPSAPKAKKNPRAAPTPAAALPAPTHPTKSRLELRRHCVFASAKPDGLVLEIGPAHNAILPKREGFNTRTVDYLDREGLVEKYRDFEQYSAQDIEEVDYVLPPGASMADVINERFDLVLASHVLEHTTSLIDFLNEVTKLLTDHGVVALVVPDHRYCFDRFRERSALSRVIDASIYQPAVHTVGTLAEFNLNAVKHRGTTSWAPGHQGKYQFVHTADQAKTNVDQAQRDVYVDVHNWIFTPHHLRLLLQDLHTLGLISLREVYFHNTVGHEFFINLAVEGVGTDLSRHELIVLADEELRSMDIPVFRTG